MKKLLIYILVLCFLGLSGCTNNNVNNEGQKELQAEFETVLDEVFIETISDDFLDLYQTIENPANFGIDMSKVEISLGSRVEELSYEEEMELLKPYEKILAFDREKLLDYQKDIYDKVKFTYDISKALSNDKFDYYYQILGSSNGIQVAIPQILFDFEIRNEDSVKYLITLLKDVPDYMESVIEYAGVQLDKGYLMLNADDVIDYVEGMIEADASKLLEGTFYNIDSLKLDKDKAAEYKRELLEVTDNDFKEAYRSLLNFLNVAESSGKINKLGFASLPDGKEYYSLNLIDECGKEIAPEAFEEELNKDIESQFMKFSTLASFYPEEYESFATLYDVPVSFNLYEEILDFIESKYLADFPDLGEIDYVIKDIPEEILGEDSTVLAYFFVPTIDSTTPNQMRVNPLRSDLGSYQTYNTVAHEGLPGHMYQHAYINKYAHNNFEKSFDGPSAYTEGYAVYAAAIAGEYLENKGTEFLMINEILTYDLIMLGDMGVHYYGWGYEELNEYLSPYFGEIDEDFYEMIWDGALMFNPYYYGYKQFIELENKAKDALGDKYNRRDFNNAILTSGSAPFSVVERHVDEYIASVK